MIPIRRTLRDLGSTLVSPKLAILKILKFEVWRQNSTSADKVARFQCLFPNLSWLMSGRTSGHQKLIPTFLWIDNCLMAAKR